MSDLTAVIGIFDSHTGAEAALKELRDSGFDMRHLSIVGKDYQTEEHVVGFYNVADRVTFWGKRGAFWGGLVGLLFGSALFVVPGLGPVMVFGPLVGWIVGALESAVVGGGLSALGAGLYSIGIPRDSVLRYETAIRAAQFLVIAHGPATEIDLARIVLETTPSARVEVHRT
jgi:uncharacterized membrane protein